jgi:hypothetical protein
MSTLIPEEAYPKLIVLINETYTDEVDRIISGRVDENDTILCIAQDGNKQLAVKITDKDIAIKLVSPVTDKTANFAAPNLNDITNDSFWQDKEACFTVKGAEVDEESLEKHEEILDYCQEHGLDPVRDYTRAAQAVLG